MFNRRSAVTDLDFEDFDEPPAAARRRALVELRAERRVAAGLDPVPAWERGTAWAQIALAAAESATSSRRPPGVRTAGVA